MDSKLNKVIEVLDAMIVTSDDVNEIAGIHGAHDYRFIRDVSVDGFIKAEINLTIIIDGHNVGGYGGRFLDDIEKTELTLAWNRAVKRGFRAESDARDKLSDWFWNE